MKALALAAFLIVAALPSECVVTQRTTAEGFPVAECADGRTFYQDMDGQPYENAAGRPVYPTGYWVEVNGVY